MDSAYLRQVSVYPQPVTNHGVLASIQENPPPKSAEKTKKVAEEGEIGVFNAEKYFSMKLDVDAVSAQSDALSGRDEQENPPWMRSRSRPATPSVRSESSYNSQTLLLRSSSMITNKPHAKQRKTNETSISFGGFRCNGPCSGGKSVNTDRKITAHTRKSHHGSVTCDARKRIDLARLRFEAQKANGHGQKPEDFFPVTVKKADIAMNLERKLSMLTWDAIPNAPNYLAASKNNTSSSISSKTQEDTASDTSSDLFEIDNITNSAYEPSEASVVWSVVTGSVADQSIISDFEVKMLPETRRKSSAPATKAKIPADKSRSGGILSGCKSQKAVSVVETAYRNEKQAKVHRIRIQDLDFL
ncbi:PREDICTED: protein PHYTOCHROME KINASE SUBSTRATE 3 [Tarenaya hassleriana]|uniref:protein PHYTOCHROME KINASE SUBSTRATE 3 n=1 Tax=Tarenaya hassleriana TaxID=28532 RepID=UPI00053CA3D3|nr:PREDICTED: protein PHYTOCHROME KINASE SUBSTRATE 3 [Tarenaya hassleriana]